MFVSVGEITPFALEGMAHPASRDGRRSHEPVRRNSGMKGRCEGLFYRRTTRQEARQIVMAARKFDLARREHGGRRPLGAVAIEVLDYLANLIDYRTGRLEPSIDTLMHKLGRSRDAIVRALAALRAHGFIDWLRRYVPTGNEGRGPRVQQTSNAYRLSLPAIAKRLLGRFGQTPPQPDDFAHGRQQQAAMIEEHRAGLSVVRQALFDFTGDDDIGASLARLGACVERESAKRTESHLRDLSKGK